MKRIISNIIFFSILLAGCSSVSQLDSQLTPFVNAVTEKPLATVIEATAQIDNGARETAQPEQLSYEFLSPTIVRNRLNTMTFEVSVTLTKSTFQFRMDALVPPEFEFSYPDYIYPNIYESVELSFSPPLEIEQIGGGGGSGTMDRAFSLDSERDYKIKSSITMGQNIHLKVIISFGEFTGITEPVPFEIFLTVN